MNLVFFSRIALSDWVYFRIANLPENLPKIDFAAYRRQLANPAVIEKLEKGVRKKFKRKMLIISYWCQFKYLAYQAPVPKDTEDLLTKLDQLEKEESTQLLQFLKEVEQKIQALNAEVSFTTKTNSFITTKC